MGMTKKCHNPLNYEVPPANQEELMAVIHPFEKPSKTKKGKEGDARAKWAKFKRTNNIYVWTFLALTGFVATIWLVCLDLSLRFGVFRVREMLLNQFEENYPLQYLAFVLWTVVLALLSCIVVKKLCYPYAAGSGVPDLKSMFSGFFKKEPVGFKVLILKSLALVLSYGSGLSIGKEGPYVHLAACVANVLLCFRPFNTEVAGNETKRNMMLAACSALGIAATFGSPIGGVLFSIEVTSTYYLIHNYWRSFFASAVGAVAIKIVLSQQQVHLLESFRTDLKEIKNLASMKLVAFILIGVLTGLLASFFIWLYQQVCLWKKRHAPMLSKLTPYGEVFLVALLTGIVSFPLAFLRLDHASAVHSLFTNTDIEVWYKQMFPDEPDADITTVLNTPHIMGAILLSTLIYTVVKLFLTAISITLPIPYGIYIPLFAIGAAFGRSIGELFALAFPSEDILPRGFAAIGAAALCGGATRTISSAVIILELTNDLNYFIPVLLAVAISCGIGNMLNHSIYDVFLKNKGLPYLPFLRVKGDSTVAHDIMDRRLYYVTQKTTVAKLQDLLDSVKENTIPIVDSPEKLHLVGSISRQTLLRALNYNRKLLDARQHHPGTVDIEMEAIERENSQLLEELERSSEHYVAAPLAPSMLPSVHHHHHLSGGGATSAEGGAPEGDDGAGADAIIDLLEMSLVHPWVVIDHAPFQVVEAMPIRKILFMFTMMGGNVLFVSYRGKLVGSITKQTIVQRLTPKVG